MLRTMRKTVRASMVRMLLVIRMGLSWFLVAEASRVALPYERTANDALEGVE